MKPGFAALPGASVTVGPTPVALLIAYYIVLGLGLLTFTYRQGLAAAAHRAGLFVSGARRKWLFPAVGAVALLVVALTFTIARGIVAPLQERLVALGLNIDVVALAKVGTKLPNGMEIKKAKIRGQASEGMLCSEQELGLSEESAGIMILPPDTPLGRPLAAAIGLDDWLLEVEITPNRGDCLSHIGIARELAAATGKK